MNDYVKRVTEWYNRVDVPTSVSSNKYVEFIAESSQLVSLISGKPAVVDVQNVSTAYASHSPLRVVLPLMYFNNKWIDDIIAGTDVDVDEHEDKLRVALLIANGTLYHETHHLMYSPPTIEDIFGGELLSKIPERWRNVAFTVANVVEDIYIDNKARQAPFGFFIDAKNAFLFSQRQYDDMWELIAQEYSPLVVLQNVVNAIIGCKRSCHLEDDRWSTSKYAAIRDKLSDALIAHEQSERGGIAFDIVTMLMDLFDLDDLDPSDAAPEMEGTNSFDNPMDNAIDAKLTGLERVKMATFRKAERNARLGIDSEDAIQSKMMGLPKESTICDTDKRWLSFARYITLSRAINHTAGKPQRRGKLVKTRLTRILTDEKICAPWAKHVTKDFGEYIILIDASGSMGSLFQKVLSAAKGIFIGLRQGQSSVAVAAHTSLKHEEDAGCVVFPIASYRIGPTVEHGIEDAFKRAACIPLRENFDGYAIKLVCSWFSQKRNKKVLIVLSDGAPEGPKYSGPTASYHTRDVISDARKRGITVLSLSLEASVVSSNNSIYGKESNVNASSDLENELERVVKRFE